MLVNRLSIMHLDRHLAALMVVCLVHIIMHAFSVELPLGLLYGPLLYLCKFGKNASTSSGYVHFVPFLVFSFFYLLLIVGSQSKLAWIPPVLTLYNKTRVISVLFSLVCYSLVVLLWGRKQGSASTVSMSRYLSTCYLFSAAAIGAGLYLTDIKLFTHIEAYYFLIGSTFVVTVIYGWFLNPPSSVEDVNPAIKLDLDSIRESLEVRRVFLNPSLTLDMLAKDTAMSRAHLSFLINTCLKTSFYEIVAWYRIRYVVERLQDYTTGTIESLAYESGFNSKTSLNKYFREFTGTTPSEFRSGSVNEITLTPKQIL